MTFIKTSNFPNSTTTSFSQAPNSSTQGSPSNQPEPPIDRFQSDTPQNGTSLVKTLRRFALKNGRTKAAIKSSNNPAPQNGSAAGFLSSLSKAALRTLDSQAIKQDNPEPYYAAQLAAYAQEREQIRRDFIDRVSELPISQITHAAEVFQEREQIQSFDQPKPDATIAVLDSFPSPHGEGMVNIIKREGSFEEDQIQRYEMSFDNRFAEALLRKVSADNPEALEAFVEESILGNLRQKNRVLESIADDPDSQINTINLSQGQNALQFSSATAKRFFPVDRNGQFQITEEGKRVLAALQLPQDASLDTIRKCVHKLVQLHDSVVQDSPEIQEQIERGADVTEELREQGALVVHSAGNARRNLEGYRNFNPSAPDRLDDNIGVNSHEVVVGSIDDFGTQDRSDDQLAPFSSDYSEVDLLAPGVNIDTGHGQPCSGTSCSAPLVAARLARIAEENPDLTAEERLELLQSDAAQVPGSSLPVVY